MTPRVGLDDYRITKFELRWVHADKEMDHRTPRVTISQGVAQEDKGLWVTRLDVELHPETGKSGYDLCVSVLGTFQIDSGGDETGGEGLDYLAALNGATILYGIIRSEVANMTSNFPGGRHVLPTVYMNEILKGQSEQMSRGSGP